MNKNGEHMFLKNGISIPVKFVGILTLHNWRHNRESSWYRKDQGGNSHSTWYKILYLENNIQHVRNKTHLKSACP